MYTDEDYKKAGSQLAAHIIVDVLIAAIGVTGIVLGVLLRMRWLTVVISILLFASLYFYTSMKVTPYYRYRRFLTEMRQGLTREIEGWFVSVSDRVRVSDGVDVHDFILRIGEGEDDERLFLWDDDKPLPTIVPDDKIVIQSYGNYIKNLSVIAG